MAAQNGTLTGIGLSTGKTYLIDVYAPDAAGTYWTFNLNGPAGSGNTAQLVVPENIQVFDFSIAASPTATNVTLIADSAAVTGGIMRYANFLAQNPNRPKLNIRFKQGTILQGQQAA